MATIRWFNITLHEQDTLLLPGGWSILSSPEAKFWHSVQGSACFVVILGVLTCVHLFLQRRQENRPTHYLNRTVPRLTWTPIRIPLVDGIISLIRFRQEGLALFEKCEQKYGSLIRAPLGPLEVLAVADPDIIQKILMSPNKGHLNKPRLIYDTLFAKFLKDGLVASEVDVWFSHRKAIARAFTYKSFPIYLQFMDKGAKELVKMAFDTTNSSRLCNEQISVMVRRQVVNVLIKIIMGSECLNLSSQETKDFYDSFERFHTIVVHRLLHPELLLKPIWFFHPQKRDLDLATDTMYQFASKMINQYRMRATTSTPKQYGEIISHGNPTDTMDVDYLMSTATDVVYEEEVDESVEDASQDNDGVTQFACMVEQMIKEGCTNKEIADEVGTFMMGGHETLCTSLDLLMFLLASYPLHQEKCREEVDLLVDSKSDEDLTLEDLSHLKYLERCILECLRITPSIPCFLRRLDAPVPLENNCFLEGGQTVLIMPWVVHRNPKFYPNPNVFDPDRFLPEQVKKRHPYAFLPFSMGPRNCIGWRIAMMEMKVFMVRILRHFVLTTEDNMHQVKMLFQITLKPERDLQVTFTKRLVK